MVSSLSFFTTGDSICIISFIPGMIGLLLLLIGLSLLLARTVRKKISGVKSSKNKAVKCIIIGAFLVLPFFVGIVYDYTIQPVVDTVEFIIYTKKRDLEKDPLMLAVGKINKVQVKRLLKKGAPVNYVTPDGKTPLTTACAIAQNLYKYKSANQKELNDIMEIVQFLLQFGADMEFCFYGESGTRYGPPLCTSIRYGNNDALIATLLKFGADPNNGAGDITTPLVLALRYNRRYAEMLVRNGADVYQAFFAVCNDPFSYSEDLFDKMPLIIHMLFALGADENMTDTDGNRPYDIVKRYCLEEENALPEKLKQCKDENERQKQQEAFEEKRKIYEKTLALLQ